MSLGVPCHWGGTEVIHAESAHRLLYAGSTCLHVWVHASRHWGLRVQANRSPPPHSAGAKLRRKWHREADTAAHCPALAHTCAQRRRESWNLMKEALRLEILALGFRLLN
jgi:hypothetical protein